ncbi:hypothetical protein [uncultured Ruminococcus sp.]|uniref:hypothetical protein n=1 Tax=uncultured Ruminococcus sp. TaxID=165186 RepID=UPI000EE29821|nr:hypothetical protein [uncultured Ruminococcus sp.]HCJ40809.1 hypothetical protein [Ruminococcus sp.]
MKGKILLFTAILTAAAIAGCAAERKAVKPDKVAEDFDKTAEISLNGRDYTARLRRGGDEMWECEFTRPDCIAGFKLTTDRTGCLMTYNDMEYLADNSDLPQYALMPMLTAALDEVIAGRNISCTEGKNCLTEVGQAAGQSFKASVKNGEITELEIAGQLTAKFT